MNYIYDYIIIPLIQLLAILMNKINIEFKDKDFFIKYFKHDVYAVGGYVRDIIRKKITKNPEIDLLISHYKLDKIVEILKLHGKVDLVGRSFGVIKFTKAGKTYDISLPRKDTPMPAETRSHKDFIITTDPYISIAQDLERRDVRCNSIAARLSDGSIIDPFQGRQDIEKKRIRLTNPKAFPDDPLRIIRAARFASVLEFDMDAEIYEAAKPVDLSGLSVERINEELYKILLASNFPSIGLEELFTLGVLRQLYPEMYKLTLCIQDSHFHPEKDRYGHHSVWQHTKITVDQAKRLANMFDLEKPIALALLLSALFHDIGKATTSQWEFKKKRMVITNKGHDIAGEKITRQIFNRFKIFSWEGHNLRQLVLPLIKCHHRASELWQNRKVVTKKAFNRLASDIRGEIDLLVYLDTADRAGRDEKPLNGLDEQGTWLLEKFKELNVTKETIKPLILGRNLIKLGVSPGPQMGKILKQLFQLQLDNEFETKKAGIEAAQRIIKKELS